MPAVWMRSSADVIRGQLPGFLLLFAVATLGCLFVFRGVVHPARAVARETRPVVYINQAQFSKLAEAGSVLVAPFNLEEQAITTLLGAHRAKNFVAARVEQGDVGHLFMLSERSRAVVVCCRADDVSRALNRLMQAGVRSPVIHVLVVGSKE